MSRTREICRTIIKSLSTVEHIGLIFVAVATIYAAGVDIIDMLSDRRITLADLLLLFIYLEVLVMIRVYFEIGRLPVRFPLYIAMVALARFLIIDMKQLDMWQMIEVTVAILLLAVAVLTLRYGHVKFPYKGQRGPDDEI